MVDTVAAVAAVLLLTLVTMATRVGGVWIMSYVDITPRSHGKRAQKMTKATDIARVRKS